MAGGKGEKSRPLMMEDSAEASGKKPISVFSAKLECREDFLQCSIMEKFANPYGAAARGFIDEVIVPDVTREKLIRGFKMLENKSAKMPRKKHDNIPL